MQDKKTDIEEMANNIFENCSAGLFYSEAERIARFVIEEKGYRKASDIAREIFEEIEREIKNHGITYTQRKIAELKKKYIGEDTNVTTKESEKDNG